MSKNIRKVQDMLDGDYKRKIQVGTHVEKNVHANRKVGDKWKDSDGVEWEQKDGYRMKVRVLPSVGLGDICSDCEKLILKAWDKDCYKWNKRCYYCQIDYEAQFSRKMGPSEVAQKFEGEKGLKKWKKLSQKKKKKYLDQMLDERDKYVIKRLESYMEGYQKDQEIWKKEQDEEKVFDKSVANALANANIDTTNVKLTNNTK